MNTAQQLYQRWEKIVMSFVCLVAVAGLVLGGLALSSGVAQAGSNGQQILATNACNNPANITWIRVSGRNQNGNYVAWEAWPNRSSVLTRNWWWKGDVVIEWRTNRDDYHHSTKTYVRTKLSGRDYEVVLLDKWGC